MKLEPFNDSNARKYCEDLGVDGWEQLSGFLCATAAAPCIIC